MVIKLEQVVIHLPRAPLRKLILKTVNKRQELKWHAKNICLTQKKAVKEEQKNKIYIDKQKEK